MACSRSADTADRDPLLGALSETCVRLADFSCALAGPAACRTPRSSREVLRRRGVTLGTLQYRAPEVLLGTPPADVTTALDIWTIGCVLAFAVTAQHLFAARSQVGMIFAILRQRGGEPTGDLETLPCWPEHPPHFSRPRSWPAPLPDILGSAGEALLGQVLSPSPRARPTAQDCLAHRAMHTPWPAQDRLAQPGAGNPTSQRSLELWAAGGDSKLQGGRGPWRLRQGQVTADLLGWLRSGAPFVDSAAWWAQSGLSWTGKATNWYSEGGRKLQIAGKLGLCAGSSLLGMSLARPFPSSRVVAFRRAFVTLNGAALDQLQDLLVAALASSPASPREWLATQATLQGEAFQEPWHWDDGASLLHLGLTLWGERELTARLADNSEVRLQQRPGWVYLSSAIEASGHSGARGVWCVGHDAHITFSEPPGAKVQSAAHAALGFPGCHASCGGMAGGEPVGFAFAGPVHGRCGG